MDSDLTMAVNTKFNSILKEIQESKLNFVINLTPFSANITLKMTAQIDRNGAHIPPSPPSLLLLEQSLLDRLRAEEEIKHLKSDLSKCEQHCKDLLADNRTLSDKLTTANQSLVSSTSDIEHLYHKIDIKEKEVVKFQCEKNTLKEELSTMKKQYSELALKYDHDNLSFKKSTKAKDKEIYNLESKFSNSRDTISNLKSELSSLKSTKSMLERTVNKLELKVNKLNSRGVKHSVSVQTVTTTDIPYAITEPLPPIFGSDLCYRTKPVFLSKCLPNLSQVLWVSHTEEDDLGDRADEALDYLYDREILTFYEEAKKKAAARRHALDPDSG